MIVVSDTSPLIALAKIGSLQCLQSLFGTIQIPTAVERELAAKGPAQGVADILSLMDGWLIVRDPDSPRAFAGLHPGESAAISLAIEISARLLIDDKGGRTVATAHGVPVIGTVGFLVEAAEEGELNLSESFDRLKATDFRFPANSLDEILREYLHRRG